MTHSGKRETFGVPGQHKCARLFMMAVVDKGHRKPDLMSLPGTYSHNFSIEAKSSGKDKVSLVKYQLGYELHCAEYYREVFGEDVPAPDTSGMLPGFPVSPLLPSGSPSAFYYDAQHRIDGLVSDDLDRPFASLRLEYGDQYLVPGEFGFWAFTVARHMRTGEPIPHIRDELREFMRKCVVNRHSHYDEAKKDIQGWQDMHMRDLSAAFHNDPALTSREGRHRLALIDANYKLGDLIPSKIKGPHGTHIYALITPGHESLFAQLERTITMRVPVIERVVRARKRATSLLHKISVTGSDPWPDGEDVNLSHPALRRLTRKEKTGMTRLAQWCAPREVPLSPPQEAIPF